MKRRPTKAALARQKKGIAARIREVRGDRSQRRLARDLGVFQQNVNRYESGTTPHVNFLLVLSAVEGVSIDWILTGEGSRLR